MAAAITALFGGLFDAAGAILVVPLLAFVLGYLIHAFFSWREDCRARGRVLNNI